MINSPSIISDSSNKYAERKKRKSKTQNKSQCYEIGVPGAQKKEEYSRGAKRGSPCTVWSTVTKRGGYGHGRAQKASARVSNADEARVVKYYTEARRYRAKKSGPSQGAGRPNK